MGLQVQKSQDYHSHPRAFSPVGLNFSTGKSLMVQRYRYTQTLTVANQYNIVISDAMSANMENLGYG